MIVFAFNGGPGIDGFGGAVFVDLVLSALAICAPLVVPPESTSRMKFVCAKTDLEKFRH